MGQDTPVIPELTRAVEAYIHTRDARMEMLAHEIKLRDKALDIMKANNLTIYTDHDAEITATRVPEGEKLKAKHVKEKKADEVAAE